MIKLNKLILKESITPIEIKDESDLKIVDDLISYCQQMGENSEILWRGIRSTGSPIFHVVNDRDFFRGGNLGAKTIMTKLGIKNPAFAYLGNMQSVTKLFGKTFAIVLKQPYRLFQSPVVDDVMAWASAPIYKETNSHGGMLRQQVGNRTEKQQIKKALEGAKTYKQLESVKNLDERRNEVIIDSDEYWALDVSLLFAKAGKFVRQFHKEKKPVSGGRITSTEDYIENYGEIIHILENYKKFTAWKLKHPR